MMSRIAVGHVREIMNVVDASKWPVHALREGEAKWHRASAAAAAWWVTCQ
jgi:hypothetical protein